MSQESKPMLRICIVAAVIVGLVVLIAFLGLFRWDARNSGVTGIIRFVWCLVGLIFANAESIR